VADDAMTPVRVLTIDDQPIFLEAARAVIESTPGFLLAGEARTGDEGIEAAERLRPDLVLIDIRMPGLDGFETVRRLSAVHPGAVSVLVTSQDIEDILPLADQSGAATVVAKQDLRAQLLRKLWARYGAGAKPVRRKDGPPAERA
jgi:DNA-binding NarL/FixJ family response regulator